MLHEHFESDDLPTDQRVKKQLVESAMQQAFERLQRGGTREDGFKVLNQACTLWDLNGPLLVKQVEQSNVADNN